MTPNRRILLLSFIMVLLVCVLQAITIKMSYRASVQGAMERLVDMAQSQARLIKAVAKFDSVYSHDYPEGPRKATLSQIKDAHPQSMDFGRTGELNIVMLENDRIIFLLTHRHKNTNNADPASVDKEIARYMRQALSGKPGSTIGLDYRGETVLAAFEPVGILNLGIVAKMDLAEIRAPFVKATWISLVVTAFLIALGVTAFFRITNPIINHLHDTVNHLEKALAEVNTLMGIIPICSFCKKIRDDEGYWKQVEVYIDQHSEAQFSHGVCPDCLKKHYPEAYEFEKPHSIG